MYMCYLAENNKDNLCRMICVFGLKTSLSDVNFIYRKAINVNQHVHSLKMESQKLSLTKYGPRCEKTGLRGFRPGPTQTGLFSN